MTNQEILQTALRQSAVDAGCQPEDFLKTENVVVHSVYSPAPAGIWSFRLCAI